MTSQPIIGVVYEPDERAEYPLQPDRSDLRSRLDARMVQALDADPFDDRVEHALKALAVVLELHVPWFHWEQRFAPHYLGAQYMGAGCRSCGVRADWPDCKTVQQIANAMGVTP